MIDWNKPLETVDGLPARLLTMHYRLTESYLKAAVLVSFPSHDTMHIVDPITGMCNYNPSASLRNRAP